MLKDAQSWHWSQTLLERIELMNMKVTVIRRIEVTNKRCENGNNKKFRWEPQISVDDEV